MYDLLHFLVPYIKHKTPIRSAVISDEEFDAMMAEPPIPFEMDKIEKDNIEFLDEDEYLIDRIIQISSLEYSMGKMQFKEGLKKVENFFESRNEPPNSIQYEFFR